jgi:hypothetical protein
MIVINGQNKKQSIQKGRGFKESMFSPFYLFEAKNPKRKEVKRNEKERIHAH